MTTISAEALPDALGAPAREFIAQSHRLLIGAERLDAADGRTFATLDPSTGREIAEVAQGGAEDVSRAVAAARDAFANGPWGTMPAAGRERLMHALASALEERAEEFAQIESLDNGKPVWLAQYVDVNGAVAHLRYFAGWPTKIEGAVLPVAVPNMHTYTRREPVGVAAQIIPWNFPLLMAAWKLGPALAAGCTVVLKPAAETPLTALALADLLTEAGVPAGAVNVVTTTTSGPVCAAIMDDPRVRKLSFTGSTEVGRILLGQAAKSVLNCSMELGGNAPFIVFDDADIPAAVEGALIAKMRNGGEACTAANRFYVHDAVADEFIAAFSARLKSMVVGPGLDESTDVGPLVNEDTRSKVARLVDGATGDGAALVTGGRAPQRRGFFYEPTLLDGVAADSAILSTEIFGPVAPVVRFTDEADAIRWANASEFGLVSYVFTRDLRRGLRVSEALDAGMIGLNRGLVSDPAAPFGGVKQSGLGREGAHEGLLEYTETKYIATDW